MSSRILIVDDIHANVRVLEAILDDFYAKIDIAYSGESALDLVSTNDYAVILMDINMPGMDGFECVEIIRSNQKFVHIPIIFVTALGNDQDYINKGYLLGAVDYIAKPVDPDILRTKVKVFLDLDLRQKEKNEALKKVKRMQKSHERILNFMGEGIIGLDANHIITFVNSAASTLLTERKDGLIGRPVKDVIDPSLDKLQWLHSDFVQTLKDGQSRHVDDCHFWRQGKYRFPVQFTQSSIIENDEVKGGVLVFQDITERKQIEDRLVNLAKFDQLTGLANRTFYLEYLEKTLQLAQRKNETVHILFIDLDRFKEVNDTLGHDAGDMLLAQAAKRLKGALRAADVICRLGGDEFAVVAHNIESDVDLNAVCEKLIQLFSAPYDILGKEAYVGCSIGVAKYPVDGKDVRAVTKAADTAMYSAKHAGRNNFKLYKAEMNKRIEGCVLIANELRHALKQDEIMPHYQVKLDLKNGGYVGAEALARWNHKSKGVISPGVFVPVAEDTGLIKDIGDIILEKTGRHILQFNELFARSNMFRISVNVSGKQLHDSKFTDRVLEIIDSHNIPANHLELEITETSIMGSVDRVIQDLNRLREEGICISIDDFGTGYSSLAYLKRLPIDTLKIDQAFVRDIGHDSGDEAIIKAIISLGHSLGVSVLAEGVETTEQLGFLMSEGCDHAQGYLFSKPLPVMEFESFLIESSTKD